MARELVAHAFTIIGVEEEWNVLAGMVGQLVEVQCTRT